ncbi:MAG: ATPase [Tenericutes bacterium HGW-Tenericutes-1]|jgi:MinD superfamily P-loop ATPase|nr:MAG: ATPase [Tenericutes bacterium HGW-Tenericutes-1]
MNEWLILSGKGGTGKTTVASAFIHLSQVDAYADCDIDAPNLHLTTGNHENPVRIPFYGMEKALINQEKCYRCGLCRAHCRFHAINLVNHQYVIDTHACEGCAVCTLVCSADAIDMVKQQGGVISQYKNQNRFVTATLTMGSQHSGLLVSEVKKQLYASYDSIFSIIDGSPGIGCPVQASMVGSKLGIFVTEPSESGYSDLMRLIEMAQKYRLEFTVIINKADISEVLTKKITQMCQDNHIFLAGVIPYDNTCSKAINLGKSVIEYESPASNAIKEIYLKLMNKYNNKIKGE